MEQEKEIIKKDAHLKEISKVKEVMNKDEIVIVNNKVLDEDDKNFNPPSSLQEYQGSAFTMCPPFATDNKIANNAWMQEEIEAIDRYVYMNEWMKLYKDLSSVGMVYLTPISAKLQDQVYISNGAWVPFHKPDEMVMANFKAQNRKDDETNDFKGETKINEPFFKSLGYKTKNCPYLFEGSADIKPINFKDPNNAVYVGAYGLRTEKKALEWIEKEFNCRVIPYLQTDPMCYHLDCVVEPVDYANTLVYTKGLNKETLKEIEKNTNVIPFEDIDLAQIGVTNFLRAGNYIFVGSDISQLEGTEYKEDYELEKKKINFIEKVAVKCGLEVNVYCLSEALKGGACLSCNVLDLKYWDFIKEYEWAWKY